MVFHIENALFTESPPKEPGISACANPQLNLDIKGLHRLPIASQVYFPRKPRYGATPAPQLCSWRLRKFLFPPFSPGP